MGLRMIYNLMIQIAMGIWNNTFYHLSTGCHHFPKRQLLIHDCDYGLLKAEIKVINFQSQIIGTFVKSLSDDVKKKRMG